MRDKTFKTPEYAHLTFWQCGREPDKTHRGTAAMFRVDWGRGGGDALTRLREGLARIDAQAAEGKPRKLDDGDQEAEVGLEPACQTADRTARSGPGGG